jgi:hypothetical protein
LLGACEVASEAGSAPDQPKSETTTHKVEITENELLGLAPSPNLIDLDFDFGHEIIIHNPSGRFSEADYELKLPNLATGDYVIRIELQSPCGPASYAMTAAILVNGSNRGALKAPLAFHMLRDTEVRIKARMHMPENCRAARVRVSIHLWSSEASSEAMRKIIAQAYGLDEVRSAPSTACALRVLSEATRRFEADTSLAPKVLMEANRVNAYDTSYKVVLRAPMRSFSEILVERSFVYRVVIDDPFCNVQYLESTLSRNVNSTDRVEQDYDNFCSMNASAAARALALRQWPEASVVSLARLTASSGYEVYVQGPYGASPSRIVVTGCGDSAYWN